ncbi:MAG: phosphotriesterase [Gammaproteobacteria bacterium]
MCPATVNTVNGPVRCADLGRTLMHEHLAVSFAGWDTDPTASRPALREMIAECVDRVEELKSAGYRSLVDPCPIDLGRHVELMGEVAARTGFNIVFATGLYHQALGANAYWRLRMHASPEPVRHMAEVFAREITDGVGGSGARAGIVKIATSQPRITDFEKAVFAAAALAAKATGAPITTHTDAVLGQEQQALLREHGVPAHRIVIGHCCGTADHDYHMRLVEGGTYLGFDRFGMSVVQPDELRVQSLLKLVARGAMSRLAIAHDSVWCYVGDFMRLDGGFARKRSPMHFDRVIAPMLREAGVTAAQIDSMLIDNPRRYFEGEALPALAPVGGLRDV